MTSIQQGSTKIGDEDLKVQNSSFDEILRKRALLKKTNKTVARATQDEVSKKLKIEVVNKPIEKLTSNSESEVTASQKFDINGDLRLKLGEKAFRGSFTKDKIESHLAFNLGSPECH